MENPHLFSSPLASNDKKGTPFRGLKVEVNNPNTQKMTQKYHNYAFLTKVVDEVLQNLTLVFSVEETLLKSTSFFPYFMLVAFEGGKLGLLRALILLLLYPLICMVGEELGLKMMVFICFFGIKRDTFRIGTSVLPKFFLEDVGYEGFQVVKRFGRKVGVTNLPRVMVEGFLKHYLGVEDIVGREIRVFGGYYLGVLEDEYKGIGGGKDNGLKDVFSGVFSQVVGIASTLKSFQIYPFNYCKDIYLVSEVDRKKWHTLPKEAYPKPLIFHDGRLAFNPTPLSTFTMFMWLPFSIILSILRIFIGILLPFNISTPILAFIGISHLSTNHPKHDRGVGRSQGCVFVSNHRTVIDPLYISYVCKMQVTALTYSISKLTEILSPIKTVTLTRDRVKDAEIMDKILRKGTNVVVCPEGTTCREPYLLRFSPLFAEISEEIVPVALHATVSMFYGTTASGIKALDPFFFMMNPWPYYHVKFLDKLPKEWTCKGGSMSKFDVANRVQAEIGKALGYKCTDFTRKDKYLMLAGNIGIVSKSNK